MRIFGFTINRTRKRKLSLINLESYTATLSRQKDTGKRLIPVMPIPGIYGGVWTCEEMEAMEKNRRVAREIYEYVKGK